MNAVWGLGEPSVIGAGVARVIEPEWNWGKDTGFLFTRGGTYDH